MPKSSRPRRAALPPLTPLAGPGSFGDLRDRRHVHSQAATLLLIGSHLRGDRIATRGAFEPPGQPPQPGAVEDLAALGFPATRFSGQRFHATELQELSRSRLMPQVKPRREDVRAAPSNIAAAAEAFYKGADSTAAAALLAACLRHPHQLVRVAAAASYVEVSVDPRPALRILVDALSARNLLVRDVAAYALAHVDPQNPRLAKFFRARPRTSRRRPSRTSTIVHGTWASGSPWWQPPDGDFWEYLHDNVDQDLYGAQDRFSWSGGYSDAARAQAGTELHDWVTQHDLGGLDLFTHSHGGSVAMLANQAGTRVGRMVLLSCPVHWPKYTPDFSQTQKVISIRVHLDLVILADRGGQRFTDPNITEHVLPIWFDHFATHDPANWQQYNVPAML